MVFIHSHYYHLLNYYLCIIISTQSPASIEQFSNTGYIYRYRCISLHLCNERVWLFCSLNSWVCMLFCVAGYTAHNPHSCIIVPCIFLLHYNCCHQNVTPHLFFIFYWDIFFGAFCSRSLWSLYSTYYVLNVSLFCHRSFMSFCSLSVVHMWCAAISFVKFIQ